MKKKKKNSGGFGVQIPSETYQDGCMGHPWLQKSQRTWCHHDDGDEQIKSNNNNNNQATAHRELLTVWQINPSLLGKMQRPTACAKRLLFAGSENLAASRSGSHILAGAISVTTGHRLSSGGARLWPSRRGLCSASRTRLSCSHWGYAASRRFLFGATATAAAVCYCWEIPSH